MANQLASVLAQIILDNFHNYFEQFHLITLGAKERFASADWKATQVSTKKRLNIYVDAIQRVQHEVSELLGDSHADHAIWRETKNEYASLLKNVINAEIAETFYNSTYCKVFEHTAISNNGMFVVAENEHEVIDLNASKNFNVITVQQSLHAALNELIESYDFGIPFENKERDIERLANTFLKELPTHFVDDEYLQITVHKSLFYRSRGAYIVGKFTYKNEMSSFAIAFRNKEKVYVDALISKPEDLSILFSFTRAYFQIDAPVASEVVAFLKEMMPWKITGEIYDSIGYNRHGKTEFYREFLNHLEHSDDQFIVAPGVKGMVMTVFMLPSFGFVFKLIKDKFAAPKKVTHKIVKNMYQFVCEHGRCGRMADTHEYKNFEFPRDRFSDELIEELQKVVPSLLTFTDKKIIIKHLYTQHYMTPQNLYLADAKDEEDAAHVIQEYGQAIKELSAANVFPGDMLFKNFGVTRHKRVVFYDYDEIVPLTKCNFRRIPEPMTPEQEFSAEPWYSVGENDIFPEEFRTFLTAGNPAIRRIFDERHSEIFDPVWWQGLQKEIEEGALKDVAPYPETTRFQRS